MYILFSETENFSIAVIANGVIKTEESSAKKLLIVG